MEPSQTERYDRNMRIPEIGVEGQQRLLRSHVCVIGLGGLGSPAALYLAAAGVGRLTLVDPDSVELSNLQRQILHGTTTVGEPKVESARRRLLDLDPSVAITTHPAVATADNMSRLIAGVDCVVEATDNFTAKYVINDACVEAGMPFATAGILGMSGQALFVVPGVSACLRCLVPDPPADVPTTAELGVLGAVPGVLGSIEALEVLRWIVGVSRGRSDGTTAVHTIDGRSMRLKTMYVGRAPGCRCSAHGRPE